MTPSGRAIDVSLSLFANALLPTLVSVEGKVKEVMFVQPLKKLEAMPVTPSSIIKCRMAVPRKQVAPALVRLAGWLA